jgi:hypothetical protein
MLPAGLAVSNRRKTATSQVGQEEAAKAPGSGDSFHDAFGDLSG